MPTSPAYALRPISQRIIDLFDGKPDGWTVTYDQFRGFASPPTLRMVLDELVEAGILRETRIRRKRNGSRRRAWERA